MAARARGAAVDACPVDPWLAGLVAVLLLGGFIMVASASFEISMQRYADAFQVTRRHGLYLALALAAGLLCLAVPIGFWRRLAPLMPMLAVGLLALVLVPGVGRAVNGATRWIPLGAFSFQAAEFVKLCMALYLAGYLARHQARLRTSFIAYARPLAVLGAVILLLLAQPDFGTALVLVAAMQGVMFMAGASWRYILPLAAACAAAAGLLAILQPYRLERLASFANPWEHQFDSGYQLTQALIAFGRGEWLGLGLGNSIQKLFFLPEAHTDFLFSIIAEETGALGAALVIALFAALVLRLLGIGLAAQRQGLDFHAFLAYGIAMLLGLQALVNLGVNLGLLPTKGLTLPFMSYGGNSLLVSLAMAALALRIDAETRAASAAAGGRSGKGGSHA